MKTIALAALLTSAATLAQAAETTLVVNSYGGPYEALQQKLIFEPFEEMYDVDIKVVTVYSSDMLAQLRAQEAAPQFDVVQFSGGQDILAAREGLLEPISPEQLTNYDDMYPFAVEGMKDGYGPVALVTAMGLLYNEEKVPHAPTSWKDLWDEAYGDHLVLTDLSNTFGMQGFLMLNQVWGGDLENWQPGLDRVGELLDRSVVITSSPEIQQNFVQNDAWIAPFAQDYAHVIREGGMPVKFVAPEEGLPALYITMNTVAGRENSEMARKLIDFALSPEVQVAFAEGMRYSPTNAAAELPERLANEIVHGDAMNSLIRFDPETVQEKTPALVEDWKKLIAQ